MANILQNYLLNPQRPSPVFVLEDYLRINQEPQQPQQQQQIEFEDIEQLFSIPDYNAVTMTEEDEIIDEALNAAADAIDISERQPVVMEAAAELEAAVAAAEEVVVGAAVVETAVVSDVDILETLNSVECMGSEAAGRPMRKKRGNKNMPYIKNNLPSSSSLVPEDVKSVNVNSVNLDTEAYKRNLNEQLNYIDKIEGCAKGISERNIRIKQLQSEMKQLQGEMKQLESENAKASEKINRFRTIINKKRNNFIL